MMNPTLKGGRGGGGRGSGGKGGGSRPANAPSTTGRPSRWRARQQSVQEVVCDLERFADDHSRPRFRAGAFASMRWPVAHGVNRIELEPLPKATVVYIPENQVAVH